MASRPTPYSARGFLEQSKGRWYNDEIVTNYMYILHNRAFRMGDPLSLFCRIVKVNSSRGKIDHVQSPVRLEWEGHEILFDSIQSPGEVQFPFQIHMQNTQPFNGIGPFGVVPNWLHMRYPFCHINGCPCTGRNTVAARKVLDVNGTCLTILYGRNITPRNKPTHWNARSSRAWLWSA